MITKQKTFDCVEMKRKGAALVWKTVKDMSREEELAYWNKQHEELLRRREKIQEAKG